MAGAEEGVQPTPKKDPAIGAFRLCVTAGASGVGIGLVGGAFQWGLRRIDQHMADFFTWARDGSGLLWLLPVLVAVAAAVIARAMVLYAPLAAGSGIQHLEAVWREEAGPSRLRVLPVKFFGGLLSLGVAGMALGREGPTVQMGAVIGGHAAKRLRMDAEDLRVMQAALAGAGLGVAFNAPLGGALFALEEVTKSFKLRLVFATLTASPIAVATSHLVIGSDRDLPVGSLPSVSVWMVVLFGAFGLLTGLLGAFYNRLVMAGLAITDRYFSKMKLVPAGVVAALIAVAMLFSPYFGTPGDELTLAVLGRDINLAGALLGYLVVRFVVGPLSYSTSVPGGLFSPLLAVGAVWGALVHAVLSTFTTLSTPAATFAVVGMAAFFAATVRAPLTGIALILEMTGATEIAMALIAASVMATVITTRVRSQPIYDSLRVRLLRNDGLEASPASG